MNLRASPLLCILGLLSLLGCDPTNNASGPSDAIQGTWYLWAVDTTTIHGRSVPLTFDGSSHLNGSDMCNDFSGEYSSTPTTLSTSGLTTTTMNCILSVYPGLDSRIDAVISGTMTWSVQDSFLVLVGSSGEATLRYGRSLPPGP